MNITAIKAWAMQPSTILGLAGLVGTGAGIVAHMLTHDTTVTAGVGLIAASVVHVVMPDNTGAQSSIEKLVTDAVTAAAQKRLAAALPQLVQDGLAMIGSLNLPPAPPVAVVVAPAPASAAPPAA